MPEQAETMNVAPAETEQQQQLIRNSLSNIQQYVHDTYGSVKSWSPAVVQNSLATIEGLQAVNAITGQLESVSSPLIESLDTRLDGVMQQLEISNISDLKTKAGQLTLSDVKTKAGQLTSDVKTKAGQLTSDLYTGIETRAENIKSEIGKQAEPYVSKAVGIKTDLETRAESIKKQAEPYVTKAVELKTDLETRASGIKTDLETRAVGLKTDLETRAVGLKTDLETKAIQWKSVRGDLSKKAIQRLESGFTTVKEFSSEQSKAILHVDLIQYASEVIDNAQTTVKPTFDALNQKVAAGILTVSTSITSFQEMAVQKSREGMEQAEAFRSELRARLHKAIAASRELSQHSAEYVLVRYRKLRTEGLDRDQIQATLQESLQYILDSPQLFAKLTTRLEQFGTEVTSLSAVNAINRLLSSLQDVVLRKEATSEAPEDEDTTTDETPEEAKEEQKKDKEVEEVMEEKK